MTNDDTIARANATLERIQGREPDLPVRRRRRGASVGKRLAAIAIALTAILVAAGVVGFIVPIGFFGALVVLLLMAATTAAIAFAPTGAPLSPEKLREMPLKALPTQTARWLDAQRPALPAPATHLADQIGLRLDTLGLQLATLDEREPAAAEVRKLVGEQLPDFIKGYQRVPPPLRSVVRNGKTPDAELIDGLKVIERQIGEMTQQLAEGDLDQLATRGRFLEIKYSGDGAG